MTHDRFKEYEQRIDGDTPRRSTLRRMIVDEAIRQEGQLLGPGGSRPASLWEESVSAYAIGKYWRRGVNQ